MKSEQLKANSEKLNAKAPIKYNSFYAYNFNRSLFAFHFLCLLLFSFTPVFAQEETVEVAAPPPLKIISKAEKVSLDAETDTSERTKLSLVLMETRLKSAEDLFAQNMFSEMSGALGGFNALMDNTLKFLDKQDEGRGKVLNSYKRLEMSLRKFAPRIELMRRELPAKYEPYVRNLLKSVRDARSKAVEPLFSDSVVPNAKEN